MKTWTDVVFEYFDDGKAPVCPMCGSLQVGVVQGEHGDRLWVDLVCKDCKSAEHFDGFLEKKP